MHYISQRPTTVDFVQSGFPHHVQDAIHCEKDPYDRGAAELTDRTDGSQVEHAVSESR